MKRRSAIWTGLAALGLAAFIGARLLAQQPGPPQQAPAAQPPRPPQTRIAVMNMLQVLKSYRKFTNMEAEMRKLQQDVEGRIKPLRTRMQTLQEQYKKPETTPEQREQIERELRKLQIDGSMVEEDAKKELTKRSGDAFTTVYRDVEDAVTRYAQMNGYELVMFYNDRVEPEKHHPANVQQKLLQPAALMPLFVTPGMDITAAIIQNLNQMYPASAAAPAMQPGAAPRMAPSGQQR